MPLKARSSSHFEARWGQGGGWGWDGDADDGDDGDDGEDVEDGEDGDDGEDWDDGGDVAAEREITSGNLPLSEVLPSEYSDRVAED